MKKFTVIVMVLALALVMAACGGESKDNNGEKGSGEGQGEQASQQQKQPKPDLKDVPDVVAKVNEEKITKKEFEDIYKGQFQRMAIQAKMSGQKLDQDKMKKKTAESMVGSELLKQEANNRDYQISQKEIDKKLKELAKQNQLKSKDKFLSALKKQGMKKKEIMSRVEQIIKVDKLIADESGDINPTEKELKKLYDQYKSQQKQMNKKKGDKGGDIPSYNDMKSDLKKQVKRQKKIKAQQKIVDQLREKADVTINL